VEFRLTADTESEFRSAGARPEVIEAIKANYRGAVSNPTHNVAPGPNRPAGNVPSGPPLSKNEIITLLQSGVPTTRVEQFVEARGVSFAVTSQIAREIKEAGGNNALIGAITAKASDTAVVSGGPVRRTAPAGPDYDD